VDREGVRVAVNAKSAYDLYLTRNLQRAKLFRAPTVDASYDCSSTKSSTCSPDSSRAS